MIFKQLSIASFILTEFFICAKNSQALNRAQL